MAGIKWDLRPSRLFEWLGDIRRRQVERGVMKVATRYAGEIETWMKANRKWTDRTGQARATLSAEVIDVTGRAALILLTHGVDYGALYLETMQGGRFAILGPALDHFAPRIMRDLQVELTSGTFGGV